MKVSGKLEAFNTHWTREQVNVRLRTPSLTTYDLGKVIFQGVWQKLGTAKYTSSFFEKGDGLKSFILSLIHNEAAHNPALIKLAQITGEDTSIHHWDLIIESGHWQRELPSDTNGPNYNSIAEPLIKISARQRTSEKSRNTLLKREIYRDRHYGEGILGATFDFEKAEEAIRELGMWPLLAKG